MKLKTLFGNNPLMDNKGLLGLEQGLQKNAKKYYREIREKDCVIAYYDYGLESEVAVTKVKKKITFWFSYRYPRSEKGGKPMIFILDDYRSKQILRDWLSYNIGGYKHKAKVKIFDYKAFESLKMSYTEGKI